MRHLESVREYLAATISNWPACTTILGDWNTHAVASAGQSHLPDGRREFGRRRWGQLTQMWRQTWRHWQPSWMAKVSMSKQKNYISAPLACFAECMDLTITRLR